MQGSSRRRFGRALFLPQGRREEARPLNRLGAAGLQGYDEEWLQQLLLDHPELLPPAAEEVFFPLIPLGREVPTAVGLIDVLYISPHGYLTVVETKLWRNPQSRREVLAQVLDYASALSAWTYSDLDTQVRRAKPPLCAPEGVFECVRRYESFDEEDRDTFAERVTENLRRGRIHLVVAGDRIQDSMESLVAFVQRFPTFQFTLSLVELEIYQSPHQDLLVVPAVVARTVEIERAVVRIEPPGVPGVSVVLPEAAPRVGVPARAAPVRRQNLTEEEFFARVNGDEREIARRLIEIAEMAGGYAEFKTGSVVARLSDPTGGGQPLTLYVVYPNRLEASWLAGQLRRVGLSPELGEAFVRAIGALVGVGLAEEARDKDTWPRWKRPIRLAELRPKLDAFTAEVERFAQAVRRAAESGGA